MQIEGSLFEYLLAIMAFFILYLLYYVYTKDAHYSRNIRSVATAVEELNRELFYVKQKLGQTQESMSESAQRMNDDMIYGEIERNIYDTFHPLSSALEQLQQNFNSIEIELNNRMSQLESGVKQISIPLSVHGNDDEKIIALFQQGIPLETISKELHISKPEVEFVLKINKIK